MNSKFSIPKATAAWLTLGLCGVCACAAGDTDADVLQPPAGPPAIADAAPAPRRDLRLGSARAAAATRGAAAAGPDTLARAGSCDAAVQYVTQCGIAASRITYSGVCDVFAACEATCVLATDCSVFVGGASRAQQQAYTTCTTACYAEGPATCDDATLQTQSCGLPVSVSWNRDGFCNGLETCLANCTAATDCSGLSGNGPGARFLPECQAACLGAGLLQGPLSYDAAFCRFYPVDAHCSGHARAHPDRFCLIYPLAKECRDVASYCARYPGDTWCALPETRCRIDPRAAGCTPSTPSASPYCDAHPYAHICDGAGSGTTRLCHDYPDAPECGSVCRQMPTAPGCNDNWAAFFCLTHPTVPECGPRPVSRYCEYYPTSSACDPTYTARHCDLYPTSPECSSGGRSRYCDYYPRSPECDANYATRYCDMYPTAPECR